jgi:hypothetical protein
MKVIISKNAGIRVILKRKYTFNTIAENESVKNSVISCFFAFFWCIKSNTTTTVIVTVTILLSRCTNVNDGNFCYKTFSRMIETVMMVKTYGIRIYSNALFIKKGFLPALMQSKVKQDDPPNLSFDN